MGIWSSKVAIAWRLAGLCLLRTVKVFKKWISQKDSCFNLLIFRRLEFNMFYFRDVSMKLLLLVYGISVVYQCINIVGTE